MDFEGGGSEFSLFLWEYEFADDSEEFCWVVGFFELVDGVLELREFVVHGDVFIDTNIG